MPPAPAIPPVPAPGAEPAAGGRRSGYLYRQVAAYLAAQPDDLLKVGEITRAIGAPSAGAVFEALKRMAAAGHATHHSSPHRFQITQAGVDAPGTSTGRSGRSARRGPVIRPNGEHYFPRRLAGATDIDVLRRLRERRIPV